MTIKAQIKAAIDSLNLTFVTASNQVTRRESVLLRKRALRGGSVGPLTVTNAHMTRSADNQKAMIEKLRAGFRDQLPDVPVAYYAKECYLGGGAHGMNNVTFRIPLNSKTTRTIKFTWQLFNTNISRDLDPSYMTYWMVMDAYDEKTADIY